ncbi:S1 RNA-binding domain-containing protein [Streptomyces arenae]|nr:S1 RNA-binding domain-containing protein [Streptomyces arenae]
MSPVPAPLELHAFLSSLRPGEPLSGTVAAVENFGVFVDLDEGPAHPVFPGVGFITVPELSWRRFESPSDVVTVGQHITGEFLRFDTWNAEARLSLRSGSRPPGTARRTRGRTRRSSRSTGSPGCT